MAGPKKRITRRLGAEVLENRSLLAADAGIASLPLFQNPISPGDVNNDGAAAVSDVLMVVQEIRQHGMRALPAADALAGILQNVPQGFIDCNGDSAIQLDDVLEAVSRVRAGDSQAVGEAPLLSAISTALQERGNHGGPLLDRLEGLLNGAAGDDSQTPLRDHLREVLDRFGDREDGLAERLERLRDVAGQGIDALQEHLRDVIDSSDERIDELRDRFEQFLDQAQENHPELADQIDAILARLGENNDDLADRVEELLGSLSQHREELQSQLDELLAGLGEGDFPLADRLQGLIDSIDDPAALHDRLEAILNEITLEDSPLGARVNELLNSIDSSGRLSNALNEFLDRLRSSLESDNPDHGDFFADLGSGNFDWQSLVDDLPGRVGGLIDRWL